MGGTGLREETAGGVRGEVGKGRKTDLELFEPLALVPAALPLLFHPLYCD